ncbi:UNVERIFIED_CONTAM: Poly(U)-binding-splicing factor PUF60, partial [Eudyptes robustus]
LGLVRLTSRQRDDLERAKRYAMDISIRSVLMKQQITHQQTQQKLAMYTQALSLMARVYIGSISFEVREENIKQAFSVFGPIKSINMSWDVATGHHKGFAFLEFEVPEAALLAQESMNGKLMGGRNLKVGRPSNMPQAQPIIEMVTQEAKEYHRVYVASVHPDLSEQDLRSVFEAFGVITRVQLAKQPNGKGHRGFGYIEFTSAQAVREAIEGMNNFDLGGQYLQVGRCITPPEALTYIVPTNTTTLPTAAAVAAAAVTAKIQAQEVVGSSTAGAPLAITATAHSPEKKKKAAVAAGVEKKRPKIQKPKKERKPKLNTASAMAAVHKAGAINEKVQQQLQNNEEASLSSMEHVEIRGNDARHMLMHKLMRTNRSSVIVMKNIATEVDEFLEEDMREECGKYGTVTNVVIVEEKEASQIRIFVRFADPTQAEACLKVMNGRWFDGRQIEAKSYDQILFEHDDFSG